MSRLQFMWLPTHAIAAKKAAAPNAMKMAAISCM
jgi:hypothetical protein